MNDFTHKINANRILTMGKGARRTWRVLGLPESREACRVTYLRAWQPVGPRAKARYLRENLPPADVEPMPLPESEEDYETPGKYDHLRDMLQGNPWNN